MGELLCRACLFVYECTGRTLRRQEYNMIGAVALGHAILVAGLVFTVDTPIVMVVST